MGYNVLYLYSLNRDMIMEHTVLNSTQLHLLKMFSFAKDESTLLEIKKALSAYFAQKVEEEMDELWEKGEWTQEKNEAILKEHLRTPYND